MACGGCAFWVPTVGKPVLVLVTPNVVTDAVMADVRVVCVSAMIESLVSLRS
jgi:hypothetical protein